LNVDLRRRKGITIVVLPEVTLEVIYDAFGVDLAKLMGLEETRESDEKVAR
jgi:hypothetical protein